MFKDRGLDKNFARLAFIIEIAGVSSSLGYLPTLIPNTEVMVRVTGVTRTALEDVRLINSTLLMPIDDYYSRATSIVACVRWLGEGDCPRVR